MNVTKTYSWDFKTYSIKASTKCSECGKPITKTFSFQIREDAIPRKEDWDNLEKEKQEWLSEESHVCSKCTKKKIMQERKDIIQNFKEDFNKLNELREELKEFRNKIYDKQSKILDEIEPQLKGRVLLAKDKEWVIKRVLFNTYHGDEIEIDCDGIDSRYPWTTCDRDLCVYTKSEFYDTNRTWCTSIDECIITDEIFEKRKELLNN